MDAGRVNNPRVARAEARLARVLREYGCTVRLVELPLTANGGDQGVDDFLQTHGVQALRDLIARAVTADPVEWAAAARTVGSGAPSLIHHLPFQAALHEADGGQRAAIAAALGTTDDAVANAASPFQASAVGTDAFARGDQVELAVRLLTKLGRPDHIIKAEGRLYLYDTGLWTALDDDDLRRTLSEFAGAPRESRDGIVPLHLSYGAIDGALKIAMAKTPKSKLFAEPPSGVAFENGFLRLTPNALELVEHSPSHRARHKYDFPYQPDLDPVLFLGFLASVFRGDEDAAIKTSVLQQYIGLCLVGLGARTKRVLILHGDTNSGKSTTLNILRALFPPGSMVVIPPTDFRREDHRAELRGALVNLVSEMPESEWLDPSAFKSLTGLDAILARRLYGRPFTFVPIAGHIFGANTLPSINDRTGASHKRLIILAYNRRFALGPDDQGDELADPHLAERIVAQEKAAVLSWILRGAEQAIKNGLVLPHLPSSEAAIAQLRIDTDPITRIFDEEYVLDPDTNLLTSKAYEHFDAWARENGFGRMSSSTFGKGFTALLRRLSGDPDPRSTNSRGQRVYKGVRRKADEDRRTARREDRPTPIAHALPPEATATTPLLQLDDAQHKQAQESESLPGLNVLTAEQLQEWDGLIQ